VKLPEIPEATEAMCAGHGQAGFTVVIQHCDTSLEEEHHLQTDFFQLPCDSTEGYCIIVAGEIPFLLQFFLES
jgi:hypothetical protein